ncbi:MAG: FAD-dependent thymidylate synthase [Synergistaceae bacterium]|jgi:thymidylate synthase (FAD)|nr:FAD-dependent thymidylate synthase [Synergistaceae bacterium]
MEVCLLEHTPEPDSLIAAAARICYSDVAARDLREREVGRLSVRLLKDLWRSGHHSPFEHASFTFGVDGLSRVTSHQLVRHRLASFSQQSQRYVKMDRAEVVTPPSIASDVEAYTLFREQSLAAYETYKSLVAMGIPAEDARFILPHGWETRLVLTMNARELHHFFDLRLCRRAQWEIRELARLMLGECRKAAPVTFDLAGPSCVRTGRCLESRPCGDPYKNMEDLLATDKKQANQNQAE